MSYHKRALFNVYEDAMRNGRAMAQAGAQGNYPGFDKAMARALKNAPTKWCAECGVEQKLVPKNGGYACPITGEMVIEPLDPELD